MNKLVIYQDEFYENPFTDWDYMPRLFSAHRDYNWGARSIMAEGGYSSLEAEFKARVKDAVAVPVYLYRHSGDTVSTEPFSCPWDSGQLGYLFFTKKEIREMRGVQRVSYKMIKREIEILKEHVKLLDNCVKGEVYRFEVVDSEGVIDSCGGFYGEDVEGIVGCLTPSDFEEGADLEAIVEEAFTRVEY